MLFEPRQKGLGKDSFLKLNDKEEISGVFRGEIYTFKRHWKNNKSIECKGEGCSICAVDPEVNYPSFRFRINFVTNKDGVWFAKIFEGGGELYDQLTHLDKKYNLSKCVVEIQRNGLKQNTKYQILPDLRAPITKEMESLLNSVSLLPLSIESAVLEPVS